MNIHICEQRVERAGAQGQHWLPNSWQKHPNAKAFGSGSADCLPLRCCDLSAYRSQRLKFELCGPPFTAPTFTHQIISSAPPRNERGLALPKWCPSQGSIKSWQRMASPSKYCCIVRFIWAPKQVFYTTVLAPCCCWNKLPQTYNLAVLEARSTKMSPALGQDAGASRSAFLQGERRPMPGFASFCCPCSSLHHSHLCFYSDLVFSESPASLILLGVPLGFH